MKNSQEPSLIAKIAILMLIAGLVLIDLRVIISVLYSDDTFLGLCILLIFHGAFIIWFDSKWEEFKKCEEEKYNQQK